MISFPEFEAEALAQGFDEVLQRQWPPGTSTAEHVHPFSVKGLLVTGEMCASGSMRSRVPA